MVIGGTVLVIVLSYYGTDAARIDNATHSVAAMDALLWAGVMSQSLLLAREAWRLRMPTLGREVNASLALYAVLSIGLPSVMLTWLGGNGTVTVTEIALGAGLGMAYATLPPFLSMLAILAPSVQDHLSRWLPMPVTSPNGFVVWAAPFAITLWLLIGWRWRRGVRHGYTTQSSQRPLLLIMRSRSWYGRGGDTDVETRVIGQRARWLQPTVDLRGCGPGHPLRSLRVALGGWGMPQTPASRVRQLGVLLVTALLAFVLLGLSLGSDNRHADVLSLIGGADMLMLYIGTVSPMVAIVHAQLLRRRWSRSNGELPLMALLPGLGDAAQARRALLRASLFPVLGLQAVLLLATIVLADHLHLNARGDALLLLSQLAGMGMLAAFDLSVLGHVAIGYGWVTTLLIYGYLVILASSVVALPLFDGHAQILKTGVAVAMALLWATFLTPLAMLGLLGWRGLQRRPHPFLANV
ncbi:MAG: hypothetical protein EPN68_12600 [Rhodanobacter sp.]|nr:MAG: hypothetical protein EPN68_12600 [Rhodanobacter sp.]